MSENALTPGSAVWNYIKNSAASQLGAAGHLAQSVAAPFAGLFGNGAKEFWNGPQDPQAAHDMSNALMTMYGGSAMNPAEEGALNAGLKVYRGSPIGETWPPIDHGPGTVKNDTFWASTHPSVSETYANRNGDFYDPSFGGPNVMPAETDFKNPLVVDARGNDYFKIPIAPHFQHMFGSDKAVSTDMLAMKARDAGHDGLVINNVLDHLGVGSLWNKGPKPATTVAALQSGTVKSPLTGETLFSGGVPLNALSAYLNQDER